MEKAHKRKLIWSLITLNIIFALIFLFAIINYAKGQSILNIGMNPHVENAIIMVFSILSMMNVIYELKGI